MLKREISKTTRTSRRANVCIIKAHYKHTLAYYVPAKCHPKHALYISIGVLGKIGQVERYSPTAAPLLRIPAWNRHLRKQTKANTKQPRPSPSSTVTSSRTTIMSSLSRTKTAVRAGESPPSRATAAAAPAAAAATVTILPFLRSVLVSSGGRDCPTKNSIPPCIHRPWNSSIRREHANRPAVEYPLLRHSKPPPYHHSHCHRHPSPPLDSDALLS